MDVESSDDTPENRRVKPQNLAANPTRSPGPLTLFPYQTPQGCHAASTWDDAPRAGDVVARLPRGVVDADDAAVGSGDAIAAVAAAGGDDDGGDGGDGG